MRSWWRFFWRDCLSERELSWWSEVGVGVGAGEEIGSVTVTITVSVSVSVSVSGDAAWSSMIREINFGLVSPFELPFSSSSMIARRSATFSFFSAASACMSSFKLGENYVYFFSKLPHPPKFSVSFWVVSAYFAHAVNIPKQSHPREQKNSVSAAQPANHRHLLTFTNFRMLRASPTHLQLANPPTPYILFSTHLQYPTHLHIMADDDIAAARAAMIA